MPARRKRKPTETTAAPSARVLVSLQDAADALFCDWNGDTGDLPDLVAALVKKYGDSQATTTALRRARVKRLLTNDPANATTDKRTRR